LGVTRKEKKTDRSEFIFYGRNIVTDVTAYAVAYLTTVTTGSRTRATDVTNSIFDSSPDLMFDTIRPFERDVAVYFMGRIHIIRDQKSTTVRNVTTDTRGVRKRRLYSEVPAGPVGRIIVGTNAVAFNDFSTSRPADGVRRKFSRTGERRPRQFSRSAYTPPVFVSRS